MKTIVLIRFAPLVLVIVSCFFCYSYWHGTTSSGSSDSLMSLMELLIIPCFWVLAIVFWIIGKVVIRKQYAGDECDMLISNIGGWVASIALGSVLLIAIGLLLSL